MTSRHRSQFAIVHGRLSGRSLRFAIVSGRLPIGSLQFAIVYWRLSIGDCLSGGHWNQSHSPWETPYSIRHRSPKPPHIAPNLLLSIGNCLDGVSNLLSSMGDCLLEVSNLLSSIGDCLLGGHRNQSHLPWETPYSIRRRSPKPPHIAPNLLLSMGDCLSEVSNLLSSIGDCLLAGHWNQSHLPWETLYSIRRPSPKQPHIAPDLLSSMGDCLSGVSNLLSSIGDCLSGGHWNQYHSPWETLYSIRWNSIKNLKQDVWTPRVRFHRFYGMRANKSKSE